MSDLDRLKPGASLSQLSPQALHEQRMEYMSEVGRFNRELVARFKVHLPEAVLSRVSTRISVDMFSPSQVSFSFFDERNNSAELAPLLKELDCVLAAHAMPVTKINVFVDLNALVPVSENGDVVAPEVSEVSDVANQQVAPILEELERAAALQERLKKAIYTFLGKPINRTLTVGKVFQKDGKLLFQAAPEHVGRVLDKINALTGLKVVHDGGDGWSRAELEVDPVHLLPFLVALDASSDSR